MDPSSGTMDPSPQRPLGALTGTGEIPGRRWGTLGTVGDRWGHWGPLATLATRRDAARDA
eukprot:4530319-Prymnesium_polylepis.1